MRPPANNEQTWRYPAGGLGDGPYQDAGVHPAHVTEGSFVRLIGVDGRFRRSIRRFPGFVETLDLRDIPVVSEGDTDVISRPTASSSVEAHPGGSWGRGFVNRSFQYLASGANTLPPSNPMVVFGSIRYPIGWPAPVMVMPPVPLEEQEGDDIIDEVFFFKHMTVLTADGKTLRGFVVAHPYAEGGATIRGVLRFVYWHRTDMAWKSLILLRDTGGAMGLNSVNTYGGELITSSAEIDCAAAGPFLWFCVTLGDVSIRRSVYMTASQPTDAKYTNFGPPAVPPLGAGGASAEILPTDTSESPPQVRNVRAKTRVMASIFSGNKNVESPLFNPAEGNDGFPAARTTIANLHSQDYDANSADASDPPKQRIRIHTNLSIPGGVGGLLNPDVSFSQDDEMRPYLRAYRSLDSAMFEVDGVGEAFQLAAGTLFREKEFAISATAIVNDAVGSHADTMADAAAYRKTDEPGSNGQYSFSAAVKTDVVLASLPRLNPLTDSSALVPSKLTRLLMYQNTLLRVGSLPIAPAPTVTLPRENVVSWGSLKKYAPEECMVANATPLGDGQDEAILSIVKVGDVAFAVGDTSVYRIHRNGVLLAINEVQTLAAGVGRYAALGVGTSMYYLSATGLYVVDGATNEFQMHAAVDRLIQEDWKGTLGSVRMAYDNRLSAIIVLNDDLDEMAVLWASGTTSFIKDAPWKYGTQGVDPQTAGFHRSFWITSSGRVFTPNAERDSTKAQTMCGGPLTTTILPYVHNDVVKQGFPNGCTLEPNVLRFVNMQAAEGFKLYFTSGVHKGLSVTIAGSLDQQDEPAEFALSIRWEEILDPPPAEGDSFSIAPVIFEVIGWPLGGSDDFTVRTVKSLAHNLVIKGGETMPGTLVGPLDNIWSNPNLSMEHRVYQRDNITTSVRTITAGLSEIADKNYSDMQAVSGPILYPAWRCVASNVDLELIGCLVRGIMKATEAASNPAER